MKRQPPFALAADTLSRDTITCLEELLEMAKRGEAIGLAYAVMLRQRKYMVDTAGEAHRNPTFARGMIGALNDQLGKMARGK